MAIGVDTLWYLDIVRRSPVHRLNTEFVRN